MQIGYNLRIQVCSNPLTILVRVLLGSHILLNYTSQIFNILCNQNSMRTDLISYSAFLRDLHSEYPWKWFIIKNVDTETRTQINRIVFTTVLLLRRTPASSSCWYYLEAPVYHSLSCQHFILFQRTFFVEYMGIEPICRWASIHRSFCLFLYRCELLYPIFWVSLQVISYPFPLTPYSSYLHNLFFFCGRVLG